MIRKEAKMRIRSKLNIDALDEIMDKIKDKIILVEIDNLKPRFEFVDKAKFEHLTFTEMCSYTGRLEGLHDILYMHIEPFLHDLLAADNRYYDFFDYLIRRPYWCEGWGTATTGETANVDYIVIYVTISDICYDFKVLIDNKSFNEFLTLSTKGD